MKRRPAHPMPVRLRPPLRHIWRSTVSEEELMRRVRGIADAGDRVNLLRDDGQRFTIVSNDTLFLVRDQHDEPIGTFAAVGECIAAGDRHLDDAEEARAQQEHDFGGSDPKESA